MTSSRPKSPSTGPVSVVDFIANLSFEIPTIIFSHLDNCDLKSLRIACRQLAGLVRPHIRFKRVFISVNPLNVQIFRAIAEHETFRYGVCEILWDDARFTESQGDSEDSGYNGGYHDPDGLSDKEELTPDGVRPTSNTWSPGEEKIMKPCHSTSKLRNSLTTSCLLALPMLWGAFITAGTSARHVG
ncbi:hypothetical protein ColTof4_11365 [Colletotrichum tofieldiae]|nr:hypothetical protein ColTof3_04550 [Colletotrichum tofieldiae]GKT78942.1 hypothetical protein ColTof4_11365 [Colletotrichum tofieldiae]